MKHYYAANCYMGTNFTYESDCWKAYRFDSKEDRDRWVSDHEYNDQGNRVSEAVNRNIAYKIARVTKLRKAEVEMDGRLIAVRR